LLIIVFQLPGFAIELSLKAATLKATRVPELGGLLHLEAAPSEVAESVNALIGSDWIGFGGQIRSKGGMAPKEPKENPVLTKSL
jgi:hypothetical protein